MNTPPIRDPAWAEYWGERLHRFIQDVEQIPGVKVTVSIEIDPGDPMRSSVMLAHLVDSLTSYKKPKEAL